MTIESDPFDGGLHQGNQGSPNKTLHEKFVSQDKERVWVETLLDCSPPEERFASYVNCVGWEEATAGWRLTIPNVTYITRAPESNSIKNAEKDKDSVKNRNSSYKLTPYENDRNWKRCVEPGTYRYVHKSAHPGIPKKAVFNKGPVKRPMDAQLQEHIRKVKEHLEKVLIEQAHPRGERRPLGAVNNRGDYVSSLMREAKSNRSHPPAVLRYSPRSSKPVEEQLQIKTKVPDVGLTYTFKQKSPVQKSPLPHPLQPENKMPTDLVAAIGHKLNELIQQDNFKSSTTKTTKRSRSNTDEKLRASYEKFTIPAHVDSPSLKPLVKVTPGQRKTHDDNEIIGAVAKFNQRASSVTEDTYSSLRTSPIQSKEDQHPYPSETRLTSSGDPRLEYEQFDESNRNFFTCGITGKAVSSADVQVQTRNLMGVSRLVNNSKSPVRIKKRGTLHPGKHGHVTVAGRTDQGLSVTNRLGDPLHRGVVKRELAGAIASELLPGVRGHNIKFPLQLQPYRIV